MALALPGASFVGVDAAANAIARGQGLVAELGLENVTLEARRIEELSPAAGACPRAIAFAAASTPTKLAPGKIGRASCRERV